MIIIRIILAVITTVVAFDYTTEYELPASILFTFVILQIVAAYAKICLGFFQAAATIVLTLQVKQKYTETIDKISFWLYLGVTIWNASLVFSVTIFCGILFQCLDDENDDRECYKQIDLGIILNGVCFAMLSIILIATVIPLFTALHTL